MKHKYFSLIELLIVIVIIAILAGLLLPVLNKAKQTAVSISCLSNVRQFVFLCTSYSNEHQDYLIPLSTQGDKVMTFWFQYLLENGLIPKSSWGDYTNSGHPNETDHPRGIFRCPGDDLTGKPDKTSLFNGLSYAMAQNIGEWYWKRGTSSIKRFFQKMHQVPLPGKVAWIGDKAWYETSAEMMRFYGNTAIVSVENRFRQFRHNRAMNIGYLDGHADRREYSSYPSSHIDSNWFRHPFWGRKDQIVYWSIYTK